MKIQEFIKQMLAMFENVDKDLKELNSELSIVDTKEQEILHYIENHKLNASQSCRIIKVLKQVREKRRKIKNEREIVSSLKSSFTDKYKNKFIEKDLIQTLKNLNALEQRHNNPKYTYQYLTEELEMKDE